MLWIKSPVSFLCWKSGCSSSLHTSIFFSHYDIFTHNVYIMYFDQIHLPLHFVVVLLLLTPSSQTGSPCPFCLFVYVCLSFFVCMFDPLSLIVVAFMSTSWELLTGAWVTYQWLQHWRECSSPLSIIIAYNSSGRDGAYEHDSSLWWDADIPILVQVITAAMTLKAQKIAFHNTSSSMSL